MNKLKMAKYMVEHAGYKVVKSKYLTEAEKYANNFHLFKRIKQFEEEHEINTVEFFLVAMYNRQEPFERSSGYTIAKNFRGFNIEDSALLSPIAEKFIKTGKLTADERLIVAYQLNKYSRQKMEILNEIGAIKRVGKIWVFDGRYYAESAMRMKIENDIKEFTAPAEFAKKAVKIAQKSAGMLDDDDIKTAERIAMDMYFTGASLDATIDRINEEL